MPHTRPIFSILAMVGALVAATCTVAGAQSLEAMRSEKRLALVIGNSKYATSPLRNPVNDARAMTRSLRAAGFEVLAHENVSQREMRRAILDFGNRLRDGGVGLFFFAGHGLQVNGRNYLVPVDAEIASESEVEVEAVDVATVLSRMETANNRLNIVILDACRDNPFGRSFRSTGQGLAAIDAPSGTMIAYATAPGRVARDGEGMNGLYTGELLKAMTSSGMKIEDIFKRVRQAVSTQTRGAQVPWESSSLVGDFVFALPTSAAGASPSGPAKPDVREEIRQEFGSLVLSARVEGIEVLLGGERIGETKPGLALIVSHLPVGSHRISARKPGYREWVREIRIAANQRAELTIDIEPLRDDMPKLVRGEGGSEMVLVPAGQFWMGDDSEERTRPRHRVWLDAYYLDKYEVTNAQFRTFIDAKGYERQELWSPAGWQRRNSSSWVADQTSTVVQPRLWTDPKWNEPRQPVVGVSWYEAEAFCRFVGKRLPTEAEWEKAARGPDGWRYPWGESWDPNRANSDHSKVGRTVTVGSYPTGASPYGAHDMAGNVSEWVADWYAKDYYRRSPEKNPPGPIAGEEKVIRGGSFDNKSKDLQSAVRRNDTPDERGRKIGFRCAKDGPR